MASVLNILISVVCFSRLALANGAVISFGGGEITQKVYSESNELIILVQKMPKFTFPEYPIAGQIKDLMKTLRIEINKTPLVWENSEVLAINYPNENPRRLVISAPKWQELESNSPGQIKPLLLHEFLPLIDINDRNYEVSKRIFTLISTWKPWDSTAFFMNRYFENPDFLEIWAENSADYYSRWGVDNGLLINYFAFYLFPIRDQDSKLWLEIFNNYLRQMAPVKCGDEMFEIKMKNIAFKIDTVRGEVYKLLRAWQAKTCSKKPKTRPTTNGKFHFQTSV